MFRTLPILTGFILLLISGFVHGLWTGRWETSAALENAVARVTQVPTTLGDWQAKELPVDHEAFAQAGARSYWMRQYTNRRTGEGVTVLLMCGRWGKMSVHTPDLCYRGAGYEVAGEPIRQAVVTPAGRAEFWTARLRKIGAGATSALRIHWGWSPDGTWSAPDQPRWTFAGAPFLYKLYIVRDATADGNGGGADANMRLLEVLLPALQRTLFAPASPGRKL
ncbi:MAG: exosortase-associated EpsI family protein [Gemmataceae bacterium]|nr:exosortase-associated EpsI family protein [Gemmataceae bacterium]